MRIAFPPYVTDIHVILNGAPRSEESRRL